MNLSELVEVYGKGEGGDAKASGKASQESHAGKKTTGARNPSGHRGKNPPRAGRRPAAPPYHPVVVPPMASYLPYDPAYGAQYGTPMFYGHPMVMMVPYPDPNAYHNLPHHMSPSATPNGSSPVNTLGPNASPSPSGPSSSAGDLSSSSSTPNITSTSVDSSTTTPPPPTTPQGLTPFESAPSMGHMPFTPNFVAPTYTPSYMYPYDPGYQYGYAPPPQKRAKRPNTNNGTHPQQQQYQATSSSHGSTHHHHKSPSHQTSYTPKTPQSPNSDSADSNSSNASSAPTTPAVIALVDKTEKSKKFHCEPCEKGFKTQQQYETHLKTHVSCPYDGCNYSAGRASLKLHELLHINNMFAKLSTPEEIAKYREERKKKFPSFARAQAAEAAAAASSSAKQPTSESSSSSHHNRDSKASLTTEPGDSTTDEVAPQSSANRTKRKRPTCKYWKQGNCNKGDQCSFSHSDVASEGEPQSKKQKNVEGPNTGRHRSSAPPKKDSATTSKNLLSQFLQSEINKENKVILECLRFLTLNHFFTGQVASVP